MYLFLSGIVMSLQQNQKEKVLVNLASKYYFILTGDVSMLLLSLLLDFLAWITVILMVSWEEHLCHYQLVNVVVHSTTCINAHSSESYSQESKKRIPQITLKPEKNNCWGMCVCTMWAHMAILSG